MAGNAEKIVLEGLLDAGHLEKGLNWQPFREGVEIIRLYDNGQNGASAALLKYAAGAHVPRHKHKGVEHIFILSGAQSDENGDYKAGTLVVNPAGSQHQVHSQEGCVVLIIWEQQVIFVE